LILGASIIGNDATELIHQFLIAINAKLGLNDLEKMIFAHPTLSESSLDLIH
jgi:dihydrolipoamide dehydrogenase